VREDEWQLFGFANAYDRRVFRKVLEAKGVGPALALGMLSALNADRLVRAIREKDIVTLQSVPRVGRKKAEQLILDLADKLDELVVGIAAGVGRAETPAAEDAVRALVSLGYTAVEADRAVRAALDAGDRAQTATELIRNALSKVGARG
jgi:holliday junction DNA helicase RuvA